MLNQIKVQILIISDKILSGEKPDENSPQLMEALHGIAEVTNVTILPDDRHVIANKLAEICDAGETDIVLTGGGVGLALHDVTPEATRDIADRFVPGIVDAIRADDLCNNPRALVNRGIAATRKATLIINLPGGYVGAVRGLKLITPELEHAVQALRGEEG